jgi:2-polyprenyl-6-methoxyphenol hydroxylase-like FAD-dependent oxidoreductase
MTRHARHRIPTMSAETRALLEQKLRRRLGLSATTPDHYDAVIPGGGVAGLTLALHLHRVAPGIRVLLVERQEHPVPDAAHKVGESTVEIAAHYLRDILGLGEHLETQQIRKFGLRMFFSNENDTAIAERVELGSSVFPPLATHQLDRGRLENELGAVCAREGVDFRQPPAAAAAGPAQGRGACGERRLVPGRPPHRSRNLE